MDREVSFAVEIGVALIALSAVIAIIWFTVFMGQGVANDASTTANDILVSAEAGVMKELQMSDNVMPTSAAYSILRTYSNYIPEYVCNFHKKGSSIEAKEKNLMVEAPCLLEHMEGKVSMCVEPSESGGYKVTIHHMNCDWFMSTCNCKNLIK